MGLVIASAEQRAPDAVVSHASAGIIHGLPTWADALDRAHFTVDRKSGGRLNRWVHVHTAPLAEHEIVQLDGLRVTSLARTVIDLARTLPYRRAVAIGDAALALELSWDDLREPLAQAGRRHCIRQAHRVVDFIDGRSESVGESYSRVVLDELGLMPEELQYEVFDEHGMFVGASDFGWPEHKTLAEFDGSATSAGRSSAGSGRNSSPRGSSVPGSSGPSLEAAAPDSGERHHSYNS